MGRSERIVAITKGLLDHPYTLISLGHFAGFLGAAKSTVSEDLGIIKHTLESLRMGRVETLAGAAGGARFVPCLWGEQVSEIARDLCRELDNPKRILPGGFVFMTDILFSPSFVARVSDVFAARFACTRPDFVLTVETKGIPLAFMVARSFNVTLAISRRDAQVTEGPVVSINYVSGSTGQVQTMSLARRAIPAGARVLLVDDFMRGGGTARGMMDLVNELGAEVVGVGVLISTAEPKVKLVNDFVSLIVLEGVDEVRKRVLVRPSEWVENE